MSSPITFQVTWIKTIFGTPMDGWPYPSNSNISKTVRVTLNFTKNVFQRIFNMLSNDMQVDRLCTCGSLVIDV